MPATWAQMQAWHAERDRLVGLAYRMLGVAAVYILRRRERPHITSTERRELCSARLWRLVDGLRVRKGETANASCDPGNDAGAAPARTRRAGPHLL